MIVNAIFFIFLIFCRTECFCGNETPEWGLKLPDTFCDMKCPGNQSQMCGGHYTINVFKTGVSSALIMFKIFMFLYYYNFFQNLLPKSLQNLYQI